MNIKTNDKKNRDKLRKEDALLSNSDGAKVRVTLEEMRGGGDFHFATDREEDKNKDILNLENTLLTSTSSPTSTSSSSSSSTSTPLKTFSKTSKFSLKNDLRELQGDMLKGSTSLLTENKEENENENENENDSRRNEWESKGVRDDGDHNDVKKVLNVRGGTETGSGRGVGVGKVEVQSIVQSQVEDEGQGQGQRQDNNKAQGKGNLISYIRMTAFDRIGSKVLVNILDDQVHTAEVIHCTYTVRALYESVNTLLSGDLCILGNNKYDVKSFHAILYTSLFFSILSSVIFTYFITCYLLFVD